MERICAIIGTIATIIGTITGIYFGVKRQEKEPEVNTISVDGLNSKTLEPRPYLHCADGWTEFHVGSKRKCFKNIGKYTVGHARDKCAEVDAALPLPRSSEEQADLVAALASLEISRNEYVQTFISIQSSALP